MESWLKKRTTTNISEISYVPYSAPIKIYLLQIISISVIRLVKQYLACIERQKLSKHCPPTIMFLTYGSDIWGFSKLAGSTLGKVFLNYNRCALHVKATTCNAIVNGECGKFPPSVHCHINLLTYYHRLLTMSNGKVVKSVFKVLYNLNDHGFQPLITRVSLARRYGIDINETASIGSVQFKSMWSKMIKQNFFNKWHAEKNNRPNTTIETYVLYKSQNVSEKYLDLISNPKNRIAISKLRTSSHNLEIERGRYTRPKVNPENRLCPLCYVVDNEIHFVVRCRINETLRIYI